MIHILTLLMYFNCVLMIIWLANFSAFLNTLMFYYQYFTFYFQ